MSETQITFDSETPEFRVNQDKRTISGLVVPWNKVAVDSAGMAKWKFREGSLYASEVGRVKLNLFHDRTRPIGKALRLVSTSEGLDGTFRIARGPEGDRVLEDAEDGILDGFSIEPHFGDNDGFRPSESDRSVREVFSARLSMVGLVPAPAYDDARATVVNLQEEQGEVKMAEKNAIESVEETEEKAQEETPEFSIRDAVSKMTETHAELTKDLGESIGRSVAGAFETMFEGLDAQKGTVKASRWLQVTEEPIYRMNGAGGPSLLRDVWYSQKEHDEEALERLRKFQAQQVHMHKTAEQRLEFANPQSVGPVAFTQDTTSAADVIPPGYRPDLFVPLLAQDRPLANLLSRGTISNATPFTVPQFGTISTDLTGDHTEGSAPTEGAFSLSSATVTPVAVSGKQAVSREIIDSSNPGIDQIVLAALREDYARQTEQKVYTELDGAGATSGDTFAAATATQDIRDEMDTYVFTRFASPTGGAVSSTASAAISADADSAGRPLIPFVGPQNAFGQGSSAAGGWMIDGVTFAKAWAMTGGTGNAEVLIVNRADAYVWESPTLTFRFDEKIGPQQIEFALFGYFAVKILRGVGIVKQDGA